MKKLVFLLAVLSPGFSRAQKSGPDLSFGSNITTLNFGQEYIGGSGMQGGLGFSIRLNDKLSLRPELNYQMRRMVFDEQSSSENATESYNSESHSVIKYHYGDFPVLFVLQPQEGFRLLLGPQFGLGLFASSKYESSYTYTNYTTGNTDVTNETETDTDPMENISEISLVAGCGYTLSNGLGIELRAQRSLAIFEQGDVDTELSWSVLQLSLRYEIRKRTPKNSNQ